MDFKELMHIVIAAAAMFAAYCIVKRSMQTIRHLSFARRYGITLPKQVMVKQDASDGRFYFALTFPVWRYANADGTRDRRRRNNAIVWGLCRLHADGYALACKDPRMMYDIVRQLRTSGIDVEPCKLEREHGNASGYRRGSTDTLTSVRAIIEAFRDEPTDFEEYCASLFRRIGYEATVTPPVNDGGYDILVTDANGRSSVVECKCFDTSHPVGRPLIQKLVGANGTVGADGMLFMTTSRYTSNAIEYAREVGVELMDGDGIVAMAKRVNGSNDGGVDTASNVVGLSDDVIAAEFPPDWFLQ